MNDARRKTILIFCATTLPLVVSRAPRRYTIDLSVAPEHRWDHILLADDNNATIWKAVAAIEGTSKLYKALLHLASKLPFKRLQGWMPAEQAAEVAGIERLTKLPAGIVWAVNALYDITASGTVEHRACTSIVTEAPDGTITHGRNLDYPLGTAMLPITVTIDWKPRADAPPRFTSVGFLGTVGFNTVVAHGAWALSHDERDVGFIGSDWLDVFLRRRILTFSFIRQLAQHDAPTYAEAVAQAVETPLSAASYLVVSGVAPGQGALLTRGRGGERVARADVYRLDASAGRWYLLETNYDHDRPVPASAHDDRRAVATRALARAGQHAAASIDGLLGLLSDNAHCNSTAGERPVLNSATVYTAVMSAATRDSLRVVLRDPPAVDRCTP